MEARKTVLVVDDEPSVRLFLQTVLEDADFDVLTAANGNQALERMAEKTPDVISLDLVMPRMSGLKFFKHIQRDAARAKIPGLIPAAGARIPRATSLRCRSTRSSSTASSPAFIVGFSPPAAFVRMTVVHPEATAVRTPKTMSAMSHPS